MGAATRRPVAFRMAAQADQRLAQKCLVLSVAWALQRIAGTVLLSARPALFWLFVLLRRLRLANGVLLLLASALTALLPSLLCVIWVWWHGRDEQEPRKLKARASAL